MAISSKFAGILLIVILISFSSKTKGECENNNTSMKCGSNSDRQRCTNNKNGALKLKIVAIVSILMTSMIGVCLPLFSRTIPALQPDTNVFVLVKAFSSGVILAKGYMHVLPDSFDCLRSDCLPENTWRKFPFTTFVAMISAILTLSIDSYAMSCFKKKKLEKRDGKESDYVQNNAKMESQNGHVHGEVLKCDDKGSQLLRYRVVAQLGLIVHSIVIGLSMGATDNPCTIRPLVAVICFHQLFEGMGLGGCILQADYGTRMKSILVLFFSITTPFGIALGIGLSNVYSENSPTSLIVVGLLNACSAGLSNYMALVDLLAFDFMGTKLQNNMKLQSWAYLAVLLGAGGMSVMAIWA